MGPKDCMHKIRLKKIEKFGQFAPDKVKFFLHGRLYYASVQLHCGIINGSSLPHAMQICVLYMVISEKARLSTASQP